MQLSIIYLLILGTATAAPLIDTSLGSDSSVARELDTRLPGGGHDGDDGHGNGHGGGYGGGHGGGGGHGDGDGDDGDHGGNHGGGHGGGGHDDDDHNIPGIPGYPGYPTHPGDDDKRI